NFTAPAISETSGTIIVPTRVNRVPDGRYTVVVRVLARNNNVYSTAVYEEVAYQAPSIFQRIGAALAASPIFLIAILIVVMLVVGFLMYNSTRQKSLSGTPVLQGRLGGQVNSRGKQTGPVIPVADDEPIAARNRPSTPPAAATRATPTPPPAQPASANATMIAENAGVDSSAKTMMASTPVIPLAKLTVVQAAGTVTPTGIVTLQSFPFIIGRTEGGLIIGEQNVSRKHAQITFDAARNAFYLTDLNSSNGTRLNNQRLTPEQPTQLTSGTMIGIGPNVVLRFEIS
ncbi:MAG TPA: FHA domain-containing protein, partial [Anaerolineales bacterium]|nr:FHA domain-containing protein [Anaerolineales bacterium]